ncbi:LysR family transcriptional regulator [Maridesulfovibrio salexigens]|uniref:Transcriptional regulator, LysR family n=1 Tax=Maridesulfovibrio salexigens (strain ATCC 14822 / DSM 2638 / NCIMB 8403 / VKM B-1763) TaxID=526222 RepID=C6BXQ9_MARSD|nr:LysR family transcriptional regulator [Maridesulfovibrio salexigens]ACS78617.1 transcriptional regulator, LysR family [Maridesulfovibrio salexigens DSM 2638]
METRQLKYFLAVAEELHFGRAAKRLFISQPPLSQQIKKFEDELGVKLFQRNKRSVALTAAGVSLLRDAPGIMRAIGRAKSNLLDAATGEGGQFTLGYIGPALETTLTEIIRDFKGQYPSVRLDLREMFTTDQLKAIRSGDIDAGIVRLFRHDVSDLERELFHRESYALVVPDGHPLADRAAVDVSELAGEQFIFFPREGQPRLYDEWMRVFSEAGFVPDVVQEATRKSATVALVAANMGIGIVPESMARIKPQGVVFKRLSGDFPVIEMSLIYRSTNGFPAVDNFIAAVRQNWADRKQDKN